MTGTTKATFRFLNCYLYILLQTKGVDLDKKVRGTDWCVTQPFPAGGLGAL